jgi:ribosome-binding factor A
MPAADLFSDDLQNADDFFRKPTRQKSDRKVQQLCRQVQRAITLALAGGCGDPMLQAVVVEAVDPAPDATRLMISVSIASWGRPVSPHKDGEYAALAEFLGRLEKFGPALRREVAAAITRKRAPELAFQLVGATEVLP